jgi:hypothetical protein
MPESPGLTSRDTEAALKKGRSLRSLAAAALVGGAAAALIFLPGVAVDPDGPVDPSSPHPISFTIADANFIPLDNVNVYLEICYIASAPAPQVQPCQPPYKTRLFKAAWRDHALATDQQFAVALDDFLRFAPPEKLGGADISIIVEYQPWFVPLRQEKEFRFRTVSLTDGKLLWISRPPDE